MGTRTCNSERGHSKSSPALTQGKKCRPDFSTGYGGDADTPMSSSSQAVEWIDLTSGLARSGIIQLALFVALSLWVIGTAFRRQTPEDAAVRSRASRVRPAYEITAQFAQAIAIAFLTTAAFRDPAQWPNVVTVSFAFLLSLGRLSASLKWRHTLLHQVNTILTVSLILLLADYLLPRLKAGIVHELEPAKLGSVCALGAAVTVAVLTPREVRFSRPHLTQDKFEY